MSDLRFLFFYFLSNDFHWVRVDWTSSPQCQNQRSGYNFSKERFEKKNLSRNLHRVSNASVESFQNFLTSLSKNFFLCVDFGTAVNQLHSSYINQYWSHNKGFLWNFYKIWWKIVVEVTRISHQSRSLKFSRYCCIKFLFHFTCFHAIKAWLNLLPFKRFAELLHELFTKKSQERERENENESRTGVKGL